MSHANIFQENIRLPPKWIELNLTKRECSTFISVQGGDETLCQCGRRKIDHGDFAKHQHRPEHWSPTHHTRVFSTDAYGTISFEGEHHPNKAHYVRLAYDTNPDVIMQLMRYVWGLQMPKLVISIRGGSVNFDLHPRIGRIFQNGLIKAAKTTSAWVLSGGFNAGVTKHLGTALNNGRWVGGSRKNHIVSVGIAPWGLCEHRNELIGRNKERVYSPLEHAGSKFFHLNPRHSNFLLVDNGSVGKFGGENYLRRRLEKCISSYPISPNRGCGTPVVVIVLEGGFHTLRMITEYLYDDPPIPVVIFAGTGRSADLVAWVIRKFTSEDDLDVHRQDIVRKIVSTFHIMDSEECSIIFHELKGIFKKKNLVTVFNPNATANEEEFDAVILASIFRSQHWSPLQQLSLTLVWDRVDIAHAEVFLYGREWSRDLLEHAMMEALVSNRLDFVNLLLEHGLNMQTFLTANRLEALYSLEYLHSKFIGALLMEAAKIRIKAQNKNTTEMHKWKITLHDIGIALSHIMGHIYRSNYVHIIAKAYDHKGSELDQQEMRAQTFSQPFDDLFLWAVLTKRHELAKLLWSHGHGALAKALVAVKINKFLAVESTKMMTTLMDEFESIAEEWESLSLSLLDSCYRQDCKMARQLLTMELENWSQQTCLTLGVMANHRMLLGHPCCQILLADLWMGALNIKTKTTLKIILGTLCPPFAFFWEYKSREELRLLPRQEKDVAYELVHHHRELDDDEVGIEREFQMGNPKAKVPDNESIRTFGGDKSRGSVSSVFRNRDKGRKTDLAQVVSKINFGSTPPPYYRDKADEKAQAQKGIPSKEPETSVKFRDQVQVRGIASIASNIPTYADPSLDEQVHKDGLPPPKIQITEHTEQRPGLFSFVTTQQNLKPIEKFIEFQKAPVTNFYRHMMAYLVFVVLMAYVVLYPQDRDNIGWIEIYVIANLSTLGVECVREFLGIDAFSFSKKVARMKNNVWGVADLLVVLFFQIGVALRFTQGYYNYGMVIFRTSSIYWNMRLYKYLGVHRFVGPKIVMMSRMFEHMACFAMIIFVVILSFGVAREAIQFPDLSPSWADLAEGFLEPYVMMFGEVELSSLTPQCKDGECPLGAWLIPVFWVMYMMVSNILIVNVLIAVFNGIYAEVDAQAVEVWMFQRFTFVMEYEQKPLLPPPFIIICHVMSALRFIYNKCVRCVCEEELLQQNLNDDEKPHIIVENDHSLKSFLSGTEQHMVFDFEEENVDLIRHLLTSKDQQTTQSIIGNPEAAVAYRMGTAAFVSDKSQVQQLKASLQELYNEMESQRIKLDKLIEYWEMEDENDEDDDDGDTPTLDGEPLANSSASTVAIDHKGPCYHTISNSISSKEKEPQTGQKDTVSSNK